MCGLTGKYYYGSSKEVDPRTLEAMTNIMSHRGPDDHGFYRGKGVGLGHRRLSILDLSSAGHQPMTNEDSTVWVVFNGEIYNYKELRSELQAKGHTFRSNCDTEVIVHAYEEYSLDCVKHFDGMFAFGLWDEKQQRLLLARDHFGIKPFYYFLNHEFVSFASEIKSILADPEVERRVDVQALSNFMTLHYVPAPRTMFEGVCKLYPGHILVAEKGKTRIERFWELEKRESLMRELAGLSEKQLADRVYEGLKYSVKQRLQSDVPVGTLLSGGLDSSAVLGLMTECADKPISAFSVGYDPKATDGFSEFPYARIVADRFKSDYHEVIVTPEMFLDFLPKAVWYQDEPIGEPASVPLYYVCKRAKDVGVTVLLSGEGSDELFAGYNRHRGEMMSRYYGMLPGPVHAGMESLLKALPRIPVLRKGHRAMGMRDFWARYQSWHTVFPDALKEQLVQQTAGLRDSFEDAFGHYQPSQLTLDNLDKILWLDLKVWLPDDLLMKKDKMGMATSLEARVPFLDHTFAELAYNIPSEFKVRRFNTKYIFKKAMERLLPREVIYRKKAGFPTPISKWMAHDLRGPITEILTDSSHDHGFFDRNIVKRLLEEHVSGRENHERLLFPILNFDLWYRSFFSHAVNHESEVTPLPTIA
ncbi:MAG: asparagine synthase (glutamine-hydrolyzing) [Acidobacteria bacterium]|nr:asparagine synthase (glutamine-hydrolyzing) [Acidobacteriota bacterium]